MYYVVFTIKYAFLYIGFVLDDNSFLLTVKQENDKLN